MFMKETINKMFISSILSSAVLLVIGLLLFIRPESTLSLISYTIGGILVIIGTNSLINYYRGKEYVSRFELFYGVLGVLGGFVLILNPKAIVSLIPFIIGVWIVISSLSKLKYSINVSSKKTKAGIISLVITILTLVLGVILIFNPFSGAVFITKMIGLFLFVYAILDIVQSSIIKKDVNAIIIVEEEPKKSRKKKKIIDAE
ncbi:MAG: hypothetical protein E7166_04795 [Firmicutes bacterium]|nr:hypothetical protein [Bacillota bacterium]